MVEPVAAAPAKSKAPSKPLSEAKKLEVQRYGQVVIYRVQGQPMFYYEVPVPRPSAAEKSVINTVKEAATRLISISPYRIRDAQERRNAYYQKVMEILRASPELHIPEHRYAFYADAVVREMVGYGIIDALVQDDRLEEIMVIGPQKAVYVFHRDYDMMLTNIEFYNDNEIQDLISKIARQIGRRVDIASPLLDARLPDGSRVNATIPPASVDGATLTIRKFREDPYSMVDLIKLGTLDAELAAFFWVCVEGLGAKPANILIAGGTGSGKTTTLNILASFVPASERIVSIEDTAELSLPLKHWIRLEARPPGLEGTGELAMDILTKNSLRMRPDRIIVGEVRHEEAFSLFTAMNTGHRGSMGTIHSDSARETLVRVTSPPMNVPEVMLSALDLVVVEHRLHDKRKGTIRRITEVAEVTGVLDGKTSTQTLFEWDAAADSFRRTPVTSNFLRELERFSGLTRKQIEAELKARAEFLTKLVKEDVRRMPDVALACQDFLMAHQQDR